MTSYRPPIHDCKIDCTNPTGVMRTLITKSDQLYLFWQNYNNLYEAYKSLLIQVETIRTTTKTQRKQGNVPGFQQYIKTLEENHERQRKRLKDEKQEFLKIIQRKDEEIRKLSNDNKALRSKLDSAESYAPVQLQHPDPRIVEQRLKEQFKRILKELERKYAENLRQQLETAKWEVDEEMVKIISHTAQACVTEVVETRTQTYI